MITGSRTTLLPAMMEISCCNGMLFGSLEVNFKKRGERRAASAQNAAPRDGKNIMMVVDTQEQIDAATAVDMETSISGFCALHKLIMCTYSVART